MARNTLDLAWAAGLFEGEGCISPSKVRGHTQWRLYMESTDLDVLERFHRIMRGAGKMYPVKLRAAHHKPRWRWMTHSRRDFLQVVQTMLPMLGERRAARAREALL